MLFLASCQASFITGHFLYVNGGRAIVGHGAMHVVAINSSPRRNGNSRALADAALEGAVSAGHSVQLVHLADHVRELIRDCRACRRADGSCSIDDGFEHLLLKHLLPADAWIYTTPLYWYGVSGILKTFLDRIFCYVAKSYPRSDEVSAALMHKRAAALIAAEESDVGAHLPVLHHLQELSRYLRHDFVGAVVGIGNSRGEITADPARPLDAARALGAGLFQARVTDYRLDTDRPSTVWGDDPDCPSRRRDGDTIAL